MHGVTNADAGLPIHRTAFFFSFWVCFFRGPPLIKQASKQSVILSVIIMELKLKTEAKNNNNKNNNNNNKKKKESEPGRLPGGPVGRVSLGQAKDD